jgi:hypothetical protein
MVKCCKRLENVLTRLAQKHGVDVNAEEGPALSFRMPAFSDFVVEFQGRMVCVAHYCEREGDQIPDPEIWLTRTDEGWVPLSMHQLIAGPWHCARATKQGVEVTDRLRLGGITDFCEDWSEVIEGHYLESDDAEVVTL